jgi:hypothetical protein
MKTDTIHLDGSRDTLVACTKGSYLFIEAGSFALPDGSAPTGPIALRLKECYSLADMIREGLSTMSEAGALRSGGMSQIKATADGQELTLKPGKGMVVLFRKDSADRLSSGGESPSGVAMNLFYADSSRGKLTWRLDSASLLKQTAVIASSTRTVTNLPEGTNSELEIRGDENEHLSEYFYKHFEYDKLQSKNPSNAWFEAVFNVTADGRIKDLKIEQGQGLDSTELGLRGPKTKADPYFYTYIEGLPLESYALAKSGKKIPIDQKVDLFITFGKFPPGYIQNEKYQQLFKQKYAPFRDKSIKSMNDVELNYYVFSVTRLGWINCDHFWEKPGEKIDYMVRVDPGSHPNVKLVFEAEKSIMEGELTGDQYIFHQVPRDLSAKIVAIQFSGSKPLLAVAMTKIGPKPFDKLDYKEFTIADLEKQVGSR